MSGLTSCYCRNDLLSELKLLPLADVKLRLFRRLKYEHDGRAHFKPTEGLSLRKVDTLASHDLRIFRRAGSINLFRVVLIALLHILI